MQHTTFTKLKPYQKELLNQAESVMKNAYNLMSHFYVGAALKTQTGKIFKGTFAENSSSGLTICAEVAAVLAANTQRERFYKSIAIIGAGETFDCKEPVTPCGRCRQFIYDFAQISDFDIEIICSNTKKDKVIITSIKELLPLPFGPKDVCEDITRFQTK